MGDFKAHLALARQREFLDTGPGYQGNRHSPYSPPVSRSSSPSDISTSAILRELFFILYRERFQLIRMHLRLALVPVYQG